jgi:DNA-binding protein YbaB
MPREIDEAWIEQAVRQRRRLDALRAELAGLAARASVTVRSGDGLVEVVVAADGTFRDVAISDAALRVGGGRELSRTVLAACQDAGVAASWARDKLSEQVLCRHQYLDVDAPGG